MAAVSGYPGHGLPIPKPPSNFFNRMPNEVHIIIFNECALDSWHSTPKYQYQLCDETGELYAPDVSRRELCMDPDHSMHPLSCPFLFLHVCGGWRRLALATPSLWKRFKIVLTAGLQSNPGLYVAFPIVALRMQLALCGPALPRGGDLDIIIEMPFQEARTSSQNHRYWTIRRQMPALLTLILEHSSRWRSLDIQWSHRMYRTPPRGYFPPFETLFGNGGPDSEQHQWVSENNSGFRILECLLQDNLPLTVGQLCNLEALIISRELATHIHPGDSSAFIATMFDSDLLPDVLLAFECSFADLMESIGPSSLVTLDILCLESTILDAGLSHRGNQMSRQNAVDQLKICVARLTVLRIKACHTNAVVDVILPALASEEGVIEELSIGILPDKAAKPDEATTITHRNGIRVGETALFTLPKLHTLVLLAPTDSNAALLQIIPTPALEYTEGIVDLIEAEIISDRAASYILTGLAKRSNITLDYMSYSGLDGRQAEDWTGAPAPDSHLYRKGYYFVWSFESVLLDYQDKDKERWMPKSPVDGTVICGCGSSCDDCVDGETDWV